MRKEKLSLENLNNRAEEESEAGSSPCRSALCDELRRADDRGLSESNTAIIDDTNILYDAMMASMNGSAWKLEPQKFYNNWLTYLYDLKMELRTGTYKTSPCSEFTLNERGKIRHIHGNRMRDRVVRHALCDEILAPCLDKYLIENNPASRKGKGITYARARFEKDLHNFYLKHRTNQGYVGFVDFSKYYDNIRHDKIKESIYTRIPEEIHWLMDEIIDDFEIDVSYMTDEQYATCLEDKFDSVWYYENVTDDQKTGEKMMAKSVNIGDQSSQNIGIYFPTPIDNYCKIVRGLKWYGRYMDDVYFIVPTRDEALDIIEGIKEVAADLNIFINDRKTRIVKMDRTFKYLQIKYWITPTGKVVKRINPKAVTRERRKLKAYKRILDQGIIDYETVEQAYKSWMGDYTKLMSKKQIEGMKQLYKDLFGKEPRWK